MMNQHRFRSMILAAWGMEGDLRTESTECRPVKLGTAFLYDGTPASAGSFPGLVKLEEDDNRELFRWTRSTPDGKLELSIFITLFKRFFAIEWLPILRCAGHSPSGIVSEFHSLMMEHAITSPTVKVAATRALQTPFAGTHQAWDACYPHHAVRVRRNYGVFDTATDFLPADVILYDRPQANRTTMSCHEGRCSSTWLPFWGLDFSESEGVNVGVGWTGRWHSAIEVSLDHRFDPSGLVTVSAGMMNTRFRLLPGEEIRQPSILLHFRYGTPVADGQNQFRQLLMKHHSPVGPTGKSFSTPCSFATWGGMATRKLLDLNDKLGELNTGYDTFWVDAGWYGPDRDVSETEFKKSDWPTAVGDWRVNQIPHPGGFKPLADAVHRNGMKFLLWVEIERVMRNTPVAKEHPEWMFDHPESDRLLLNLGHLDARQWAIDTIDRLVREEGVDCYRQDFNFDVRLYWDARDAEDRKGISEAKHIDGLYRFWDAIRKMHPHVLIDNCASGGRRIDWEAMSRSICLWRDDILGRPWFDASDLCQTQIAYLSQWVPLHAGGVTLLDGDDYTYLSCVSSGFSCFGEIPLGRWLGEITTTAKRMAQFFDGNDFYLLTEAPEDYRNYCAYQCHDRKRDAGFVVVFRRRETIADELSLRPMAIAAKQDYRVERFRHGARVLRGTELMEMKLSDMKPRSVELFFYSRSEASTNHGEE